MPRCCALKNCKSRISIGSREQALPFMRKSEFKNQQDKLMLLLCKLGYSLQMGIFKEIIPYFYIKLMVYLLSLQQ